MVEGTDVRGSKMSYEDLLILYHQHMVHTSYGVLSQVYPHLFEKANKTKLVCDACKFGNVTKSSYDSSSPMSSQKAIALCQDIRNGTIY